MQYLVRRPLKNTNKLVGNFYIFCHEMEGLYPNIEYLENECWQGLQTIREIVTIHPNSRQN